LNRDSENPLTLFPSNPWLSIDLDILINKGIIKPIGKKYLWTKSKTSLAQYFNKYKSLIKIYTPGGYWAPIESNFLIKGKQIKRGSLRRLAGKNGNILKPHESEDFKEVKKIVEEYREKVKKQKEEQKTLQKIFQTIEKIIKNVEETEDIETLLAAKEKIKKILA
jgi:tRNA-dihydrouridine synthase